MTYVHIIKLNKERNIYLSITTPPPHTILHMHIRNYKESLTMKEDKSTLLVYLLISLCMSMSLSKLAFLKGLLIYSIVFVYTCERLTPSTSFHFSVSI